MMAALVLVLLIPVIVMLGGWLSSTINPEVAAGHVNYARNYHILSVVKVVVVLAAGAVAAILWLVACFMVIRSKERSAWWLMCAALGPIGFAILARLSDRAPGETNRYERWVSKLKWFVRAGYEVGMFVVLWELAYLAMVLKRNLMIQYESAATGVATAQIIATQNASSGMWAFGEWMETMYWVVLLYLLWPIVFNFVGGVAASVAPSKAR